MNDSDQEPDLFTQALRADLPSERDQARIKARLITAGVLAGATLVTPSTAAAAASGGFLSKLASLPLSLKVGASVVVVGAAAVPVFHGVASDDHAGAADAPVAVVVAPKATALNRAKRVDEPRPAPAEVNPPALAALPAAPVAELEPAHTEPVSVRRVTGPAAVRGAELPAAQTPSSPAVGAFPVHEVAPVAPAAPVDEGTLRAETALMERALAAIRRNDFTTARRDLAAHAAEFPNGHLKPERERALERMRGKETER
jgi:hypothetical protein